MMWSTCAIVSFRMVENYHLMMALCPAIHVLPIGDMKANPAVATPPKWDNRDSNPGSIFL